MALSKIIENSLADEAVSSAKLKDFSAAVDLNGVELVLDADADTSITADTDDRIDFKIAGVEHFSFSNSSGDTIIKPMVDAKDIKFQQFDGRTLLDINDGGFVGIANGATSSGEIRFFEDTDNGSNYVGLNAGSISSSFTLTLPTADGSSGQFLKTDGSGALSFDTVSSAADDLTTGDAAVTLATSAGNITIDAQGNDTDIIFKGTDGSADTTFLTIDGSAAGAATFNAGITATTGTFSGVVDADAGVTIDNITIDGTEIDLSSGDLTVDVAGDITLDADGADINLADGGTTFGTFTNSSSDFVIDAAVQDKDIIFKGDDGGSAITSLTLDMSNSGAAIFSAAAYNAAATLKDASTISWNAITQPVAKVTLGANRTLGAASGGVAGQFVSLLIIQDGTGSRTVTFNAAYEFAEDTAPTLTTTASKGDLFVFRYNGSKWLEVGRNLNLTLS